MAKLDATAATQKWLRNFQAASESMKQGAESVTTSPGQLAARNKDAYLAGVQRNVNKWAAKVARVDLGSWQSAYTTLGIPRAQAGAQAKQSKMQDFLTSWLPKVHANAEAVRAMPKGTLEQGIARAAEMIRRNHAAGMGAQ